NTHKALVASQNKPLTAATCIDNPFDLEEATRSSPYHMAIDQKFTGGLIDILRSNKVGDFFQSSVYFGSNALCPSILALF
ncbi:hypothetical protein CFP56_028552, partial [Quercus suber]